MLSTFDRANAASHFYSRLKDTVTHSLMIALLVIMGQVLAKCCAEGFLPREDFAVQALLFQ